MSLKGVAPTDRLGLVEIVPRDDRALLAAQSRVGEIHQQEAGFWKSLAGIEQARECPGADVAGKEELTQRRVDERVGRVDEQIELLPRPGAEICSTEQEREQAQATAIRPGEGLQNTFAAVLSHQTTGEIDRLTFGADVDAIRIELQGRV